MIGSLWFNSFSSGAAPVAGTDYELISTTILSSTTSSVTFSGLGTSAAAYKHLQVRMTVRDDRGGFPGSQIYMRLNGDTGTNYSFHALQGSGTAAGSGSGISTSYPYLFDTVGSGGTTNAFAAGVIDLLDFQSSTKNKTVRTLGGMAQAYNWLALSSNLWMNTAPVTSITFLGLGNFVTGSRFSLYGLKG